MSEEIDVHKMAAEFVTHNLEKFYSTGKDVLKVAADTARLHLSRSYKDYLACVGERYSRAKSFFIRNEPTRLYDFYVPIGISSPNFKIGEASVRAISAVNRFAVITGGGGSGKSMLMRHLLLNAVMQKEKVPVFLELRELNQTRQSLTDFIKDTLHSNRFSLGDEYIERALKAGHFALIFDGFDELADSFRKDVRKQISQLAKDYDRNVILVSSRPDIEFSGWSAFSVFRMDALTLERACELVGNLPFDGELKTKFLNDLPQGLFRRHHSFLSNPLLLSIMLLTYGESADIPNKLSIFYSQAYEVLFQRHDALKAGFRRERLTGLDIQDFAKVFSVFSLHSYDKRIFQMSRMEALDFIEKSKKLSSLDFSADKFLQDAEQTVCLLVEDGLQVVFAHRSFQEYFTAKYILNAKPGVQERLINKYSANVGRDSVMRLLYEMNPELVERQFIIPAIQNLKRQLGVKRRAGITHHLRYIKKLVVDCIINLETGITFHVKDTDLFEVLDFILEQCEYLVEQAHLSRKDYDRFWKEYAEKNGPVVIPIASLKPQNEFTRHLAEHSGLASRIALNNLLKIEEMLLKKHQNLDESLDEIILS